MTCVTRSAVVFHLGQVEEAGRQGVAVLLPPATGSIGGHDGEGVDQGLVRAAVDLSEPVDAVRADAEAADPSER